MVKLRSWPRRLRRGEGDVEYPIGTLIFYGPDNRRATKAVAAVFAYEGDEPLMQKWFSDAVDLRVDRRTGEEVASFFRRHAVRRVSVMNGIFGCPHEEGIDYPNGGVCPRCPFWAKRDRFEEVVPSFHD
jgi:hypothetical protein